MKINKDSLAKHTVTLAFGIGFVFFYHWLIGGSWWLAWVLATLIMGNIELRGELRQQKRLFAIADAELVRVSVLTNYLEEKILDLESKIEHVEHDILMAS